MYPFTEFSGYKIARFYDKNLKTVLKEKIENIYNKEKKEGSREKRIIRVISKAFKKKYGLYMIYYVIIELFNESEIDFCRKTVNKIQKRIL